MPKHYYTYILTNKYNKTLYTGVTSDLEGRIYEHKNKATKSFASKYNVDKLIYYDYFYNIRDAIDFEKQIKGWNRQKKINLINSSNKTWKDLSQGWHI